MNWYSNYLALVSFLGNNQCTRSSVEHIKNGYFKDKLDHYIKHGVISVDGKTSSKDDLFGLTNTGLKLWRQEIAIEDILDAEEKR